MAAKMVAFLVTSQASSSATTHTIIPHLVKKIKGFPLKVKLFRYTATYQKLRGGFHPPLPCTTVGVMTLCVRPRVKFANEYNHNFCLVITTFYPFTLMFCTLSYHSTRDLYYEMLGYFFTIHSLYSLRFYIFVVVGFI